MPQECALALREVLRRGRSTVGTFLKTHLRLDLEEILVGHRFERHLARPQEYALAIHVMGPLQEEQGISEPMGAQGDAWGNDAKCRRIIDNVENHAIVTYGRAEKRQRPCGEFRAPFEEL